jgi:hypothetical protein
MRHFDIFGRFVQKLGDILINFLVTLVTDKKSFILLKPGFHQSTCHATRDQCYKAFFTTNHTSDE